MQAHSNIFEERNSRPNLAQLGPKATAQQEPSPSGSFSFSPNRLHAPCMAVSPFARQAWAPSPRPNCQALAQQRPASWNRGHHCISHLSQLPKRTREQRTIRLQRFLLEPSPICPLARPRTPCTTSDQRTSSFVFPPFRLGVGPLFRVVKDTAFP